MPDPVTVSPETAAPAAPETQPATAAAVAAGKTADYQTARRAERMGTPLAPVPVTASADATEPGTPPVPAGTPRKSRDEEYISTRIRDGVASGTAELRAEIDRIKQQVQAHPPAEARREPAKPYDGTDPSDPKPRAETFDDHEQYLDARDEWTERRIERKQASAAHGARVTQEQTELSAAQQARVEKFGAQLDAAKVADPTFTDKLSPQVRALRPLAALLPGEAGGAEHIVAEQVFDSPIAPQVLLHLSAHPEALARLTAMPPEIQAMPAAVRVARHIHWIVKEFGKLEATLSAPETAVEPPPPPAPSKTLTSAPSPAQTLGSKPAAAVDPKAAAVKSGNTQAYRDIRRRERAEQMAGR